MIFRLIISSIVIFLSLINCESAEGYVRHSHSRSGYFYHGKWFYNYDKLFKASGVITYWFNQTLDHFNSSETRTWSQRYFINDTFYKPGGPIFIMIGGEGEDNPLWMSQGAWIHYAKELNAFCFSLEHRFYGKSHPTPDLSVENLAYLTSEQALADLASFTQAMNDKYGFHDNKWVAFGGSYPGNLAAWFRLKYPDLIHAAVSTSAPLLAQLNFKEYLGVVQESIIRTDPKCLAQISSAVKSMQLLLKRRTGWWMLQKYFKTCSPLQGDNSKDVANFFETLAGNFEDIVQYNEDNRGFEGSATANITIKTLCDIMSPKNNSDTTPLENYASVNNLMLGVFGKNCTDISYSGMINGMREVKWDSEVGSGARQWTFQTCNEFGYFQTSDGESQPFGKEFGISFSLQQCRDIYGDIFDQKYIESRIQMTNDNYGGKGINVTRVIFINGSIDPWHALGITNKNQTSAQNDVIFIEGTAHCANMYPDAPSDVPQLRRARTEILNYLKNHLNST